MTLQRDILRQQLCALGLPDIEPEPEVVSSIMAKVRTRSLARIIVALLTEHEPMLRASQDGSSVTVSELGDGAVMRFTISEPTTRDGGSDRKLPSSNQ